jgi:hypothetical protein
MSRFHWAMVRAILSRRRVSPRPDLPFPPRHRKPRGGVAMPETVEPDPKRPLQGGAAAEMEFDS